MLTQYDKSVHPVGEGLSDEIRVHRIKVVTTFMKAGIPLNKVDICQELLEENAYRLCDSSHLYELIPFIHKQEQSSIQNQIRGKNISVIFDGTTHICEALAIIIRFVDDEWNVKQRAVRVMLLAKNLTGEEVAHQLIVCLSTEYGIGSNLYYKQQ